MKIESGEDVVNTTLDLSLREDKEGRMPWSLTVPGVVERRGRLVCRTNQPYLHLNALDVMEPPSSSLNLTVTTATEIKEARHFNLTVSLESNHFDWEMINDTR